MLYPKFRVIHETSGLPKTFGITRYFGLPTTQWFSKLHRIGFGYPLGTGTRVLRNFRICLILSIWTFGLPADFICQNICIISTVPVLPVLIRLPFSMSLFWILILHKLLVTCFLAVGTFPQATETTVLCLASPTSISGYTASNPNYFYISLIHLMKKRNFSFPIPPRIVQRLFDMQDVQLQQFSIRMILKWEVGKNQFYFPIFLARAVQAAAAYFYPMANMKCQSFGCKNRRRGKTSRRVENMMLASKLRICSLDIIVNTVFVYLKLFNNTVFFFLFMFCIMLIKWEFMERLKSKPLSLPLA